MDRLTSVIPEKNLVSPVDAKDLKGFTLLEILIAIVILVTVLSTVFASFTGTLRLVSETESQAEVYQMARIALERITEDLESVYVPPVPLGPAELEEDEESFGFSGEDKDIEGNSADSLRFLSRAHLVLGEQDLPCGTAEIGYYVKEHEEEGGLTLYRSDRLQLEEELEQGEGGLPLCERLVSVNFSYYDADGEEYDSWDPTSEEGVPQIVSISLEFVNPADAENPLKFVTSVALPMSEV